MVVETTEQRLNTYREDFRQLESSSAGHQPRWLRELREDAFTRFGEVGFPTTHVEDWRFTNVSAIAQTPFRLARDGSGSVSQQQIGPLSIAAAACRLVFVNSHFAPELSAIVNLPEGVRMSSLAKELEENSAALKPYLGQYLDTRRDAFCALNTAFIEDGAYVHIGNSIAFDEPIHLLFISDQSSASVSHPRNLIVAEEGSQVAVVEEYVSLGREPLLCNSATELVARDGAVVSHYRIEREHALAFSISTLRIEQARNANVASHSVLTGGALVRNNVHPVMSGAGGECLINGLFIGNGRQHLDNYMLVEHASPHCNSRQFYNGILDDRAHGVFHGRIVVRKDAQKTDAKQTNRNLLLSDNAQIDTKPQLEIFADDVKCTHGATIGQIEESAIFYLRSRGIDELSARQLLLLAFAGECLERMSTRSARTHVEELIHARLLEMSASQKATLAKPSREVDRNWEEIQ
jgi:Fe-S cluster assembly protein SufD